MADSQRHGHLLPLAQLLPVGPHDASARGYGCQRPARRSPRTRRRTTSRHDPRGRAVGGAPSSEQPATKPRAGLGFPGRASRGVAEHHSGGETGEEEEAEAWCDGAGCGHRREQGTIPGARMPPAAMEKEGR
jgi:hypothetical protein